MNENSPLIVANLKANKTGNEISSWLEAVSPIVQNFAGTVIFCPSHAFLASSAQFLKSTNSQIILGAQDISRFDQGAYTGEVAASQIADIAKYSLIGHSERRQNFNENEDALTQKVEKAKKFGIEPIFCVQGSETPIPSGVNIVAYEPVFAIGTGNADTPENIQRVTGEIKEKGNYKMLYGGSASESNAKEIVTGYIDGILVGATNSLDPQKFIAILKALG